MATNGNEWQSLVPLAEWQADILLFLPLSSHRLRMPLYAIKGASPDVIQCHKSKSFPLSNYKRKPKNKSFPLYSCYAGFSSFAPRHCANKFAHCPRFGVGSAFTLQTKTKSFPLSAFRFPFFTIFAKRKG